MRKTQIITLGYLVTLSMFILSCGSKTSKTQTVKLSTGQTEDVKYQCPMKCEGDKMYNKSGQCPVCNMDLIKIESNYKKHQHD